MESLLSLLTRSAMQVLLSNAEPVQLVALRDALNAALLRAMGRPLKPLEPNVLALQVQHCASCLDHTACAAFLIHAI